jgi:predicted nucleic acid-binding protein
MLVLLDSTVLIDYLRGRPIADRVDALQASGDVVCTTGVNVEEIVRGLRPSEITAAEQLFTGLEIIPIGAEEGWRAGEWRRDFAVRGITLSTSDCLVAAAAATSGAKLVTGNPRHFPMTEVDVENWPSG